MAWITNTNLNIPSSAFYEIPTGGARPNEWYERPNTYLETLGAQRAGNPPVGWDDQPAQLGINPDMLNDPAFSEYDLSNLRKYEQDPRLRDEIALGITGTKSANKFALSPDLHARTAGFTYPENFPGDYDPSKVYVNRLNELKMATGPGAEQTKQGNINKKIASTIAHEFRHNMFDKPEYSGIIDAAYNRFGGPEGNISRFDLEEYINRAADVQLMPESWLQGTLDDYQDEYNEMLTDPESWIENEEWNNRYVPSWKKRELIARKMPAHLTGMNTTKQFNQAAEEFFKRVKYNKMSKAQKQTQMQKTIQQAEAEEAAKKKVITTGGPPSITQKPKWTPPQQTGGDGGIHGGGGRPQKGNRRVGRMPIGTDTRNPWGRADGGLMDIPLTGRSRYI